MAAPSMPTVRIFAILTSLCFAGIAYLWSAPTSANPCADSPYQHHSKGPHNFETSSAFKTDGPLNQYWTCVRNLDTNPNNDLKVDWYIPGPHKVWIPGGRQLEHPRRSADPDFRPLDGHLEYGHLGEATIAEFLGDSDEEKRAAAAKQLDKQQTAADRFRTHPANQTIFPSPREGWTDSFRLFFPTDSKHTTDTMIQLDATVSVSFNSDAVDTRIAYNVRNLEGRNGGDPSQIRFLLRFPHSERSLADIVYSQVATESVNLGNHGEISFSVPQSNKYRISPMKLLFFSGDNGAVSSLDASVLSPVRGQ